MPDVPYRSPDFSGFPPPQPDHFPATADVPLGPAWRPAEGPVDLEPAEFTRPSHTAVAAQAAIGGPSQPPGPEPAPRPSHQDDPQPPTVERAIVQVGQPEPSADLQMAKRQAQIAAGMLKEKFGLSIDELGFAEKDDALRSVVSNADTDISNLVVENIGTETGEKTITEEYADVPARLEEFVAEYDEDGWCLDPLDGSKNFKEAVAANPQNDPALGPRLSLATVSLAKIVNGEPKVGALVTPLVAGPSRMYSAETGQGAFLEAGDLTTQLRVDPSHNSGIILVSENQHPHIDRLAEVPGLVPVRLGGLAFKMLCVTDPDLVHTYEAGLSPDAIRLLRDLPVIGIISPSASLHDYAAATVVGREAGAIVSAKDGSERVRIGPGEHGVLMANNARTHGILVDIMRRTTQR